MKKILLALPLVAGASWAGTTLYSGNQTESAYNDLLAQLNELSSFTLVSESYDSGFTNSRAMTRVMDSAAADAKLLFRLQHDIDHSPLAFGDNGARIGAASISTTLVTTDLSEDAQKFIAHFDANMPFELNTHVQLSGESSSNLMINKASYTADDVTMSFDGAIYQFDYQESGTLIGNGQIGKMLVAGPDGTAMATISASTQDLNMKWVSKGIYTGNSDLKIPSIVAGDPAMGMVVELTDFSVDSEQRLDGETMFNGVTLAVDKLDAPIPVTAASLTIEMDGFKVSSLEKFLSIQSRMYGLDAVSDEEGQAFAEALIDAYKGLFNPGASFAYNMNITNDGGDIAGTSKLTFVGDGSPSGSDYMVTVGDLVRALSGQVTLDADAPALEQTPAAMFLMDPSVSSYVLNDGVKYRSDIKVADMILDINGEPLSLELMMGEMLEMPLDFSMLAE